MLGQSIRSGALKRLWAAYCLTAALSIGLGIAGGLFLFEKYSAQANQRDLGLHAGCANDICMA